MHKIYFETIAEWENWLIENHERESELWLIFYKKHTNKSSLVYNDSVKIALCYGWIDSLIKSLDNESYARKFSIRKEKSNWSESNKKRAAELLEAGKMQKAGLHKVEAAKQNGMWDKIITPPKIDFSVPPDFQKALDENTNANIFFKSLPKTKQKEFLIWITMAKRLETRTKRIAESISLLSEKKRLGLK